MDLSFLLASSMMASPTIARWANREHRNTLPHIERMLSQLGIATIQFSADVEVTRSGSVVGIEPGYLLPRDLVLTLICGWDIHVRMFIIRDWIRLEHVAFTHVNVNQLQTLFANFGRNVTLDRHSRWGNLSEYTLNIEDILLSTTQYARPMTSSEISDGTGRDHIHVTRDIQGMFRTLGMDDAPYRDTEMFTAGGSAQRTRPIYRLTKELTLILVTGYDPKEMRVIVQRWLVLSNVESRDFAVRLENHLVNTERFSVEYSF